MRKDYWAKLENGGTYHIYNRSINKEPIFRSSWHYHFFLKKWEQYLGPFLKVYAFCVVPDHFHFLASVRAMDEARPEIEKDQTVDAKRLLTNEIDYAHYLERRFKRLFSSYAHSYNLSHARHGSVFQKRFKRIALRTAPYQISKLQYIHHNPIHHCYADNYEDWEYSSYRSYLTGDSMISLHCQEILSFFDQEDRAKALALFIQYHEEQRRGNGDF